jgi:glutathione synthase/RimK-type ligase-like ATP-grasp enzyme
VSDRDEILVLTNERDFAADLVIEKLTAMHCAVRRLNAETLPGSAPPWSPHTDDSAPNVVWLRQALPMPTPRATVVQLDEDLVTADQWRSYLSVFDHPESRWMNPLWAGRAAEDKLRQLRVAVSVGLSVPPTIVTNSRETAAAFKRTHGRCVIKTLRAGYFARSDQAFMFTRELDDAVLTAPAAEWETQPVVVQRRVRDRRDIRCFVVADTLVAAAIARAPGDVDDWRTVARDVEWEPAVLDERLRAACVSYAQALGLAYCALDLAADESDVWFLEGNQAGEFAFVDRPLELGVADAIASFLAGQA